MSLDVHLYGELTGTLVRTGPEAYEFRYAPEALERYGRGAALLSTSLPTAEEPFSPDTTRAYVEGLLPQGMRRLKLARELGLDPDDGYALIAALGRDCAGAAVFLPTGERVSQPAAMTPAWATADEMEELVAAPPPRLLDPERPDRMRAVLPGVRHKISLARTGLDNRWAWPRPEMPSTHIVKPETGEHPEMVPNEMFCTAVAAEAGLFVAPTGLETVGGRLCVVSERFDRTADRPAAGRFHQESFCQALGFEPPAALEGGDPDGPGFAESCGLLRAIGEGERIPDLLAATLCNYILGNGDSHGSNFAVMVVPGGSMLAPFYDIVSTAVYDDPTHVGMTIAEDYEETAYLLELAEICEEAAIDFQLCRRVAANVAGRMRKALQVVSARARSEGWHAPVIDGIVDLAGERALHLGYEVQY